MLRLSIWRILKAMVFKYMQTTYRMLPRTIRTVWICSAFFRSATSPEQSFAHLLLNDTIFCSLRTCLLCYEHCEIQQVWHHQPLGGCRENQAPSFGMIMLILHVAEPLDELQNQSATNLIIIAVQLTLTILFCNTASEHDPLLRMNLRKWLELLISPISEEKEVRKGAIASCSIQSSFLQCSISANHSRIKWLQGELWRKITSMAGLNNGRTYNSKKLGCEWCAVGRAPSLSKIFD